MYRYSVVPKKTVSPFNNPIDGSPSIPENDVEIFLILVVSTLRTVIPEGVKRNKFSLSLTRPFIWLSIMPSDLLSITNSPF